MDCNGSNGGLFKPLSTVGKSQGGTVQGCEGLIILEARKNGTNRTISAHLPASNRQGKASLFI